MKVDITVKSEVKRTARDMQAGSMFDVSAEQGLAVRWVHDLPLDEFPWSIGAVVGPSGCGKSVLARKVWPEQLARFESLREDWPSDMSIVNGFPKGMSVVEEIIPSLSSVGFNSPPAWKRPFHVLSNGEQFRVMMARVLAETKVGEVAVVDEFTSVVDRTVARVGSCALAKAIRRSPGKQFVAVTCHDDIVPWLQPDWVYYPAEQRFARRSVQPRPPIVLTVYRTKYTAWKLFQPHHYLTHEIHKSAFCFVAYAQLDPSEEPRLVAFDAWLPFFGKLKGDEKGRRGHRTVCLPDFQGVSIGANLFKHCARMWKGLGFRAMSATAHPAEIASRKRDRANWLMTRAPSRTNGRSHHAHLESKRASDRMTASFDFIGEGMTRLDAERQLETWCNA